MLSNEFLFSGIIWAVIVTIGSYFFLSFPDKLKELIKHLKEYKIAYIILGIGALFAAALCAYSNNMNIEEFLYRLPEVAVCLTMMACDTIKHELLNPITYGLFVVAIGIWVATKQICDKIDAAKQEIKDAIHVAKCDEATTPLKRLRKPKQQDQDTPE